MSKISLKLFLYERNFYIFLILISQTPEWMSWVYFFVRWRFRCVTLTMVLAVATCIWHVFITRVSSVGSVMFIIFLGFNWSGLGYIFKLSLLKNYPLWLHDFILGHKNRRIGKSWLWYWYWLRPKRSTINVVADTCPTSDIRIWRVYLVIKFRG